MASNLERKLLAYLDSYATDFRRSKILNMLAIVRTINAKGKIKIDDVLAINSIDVPFLNKERGLDMIKDMIRAGQLKLDKKTGEVEICE